jgi:serine/threonine protein kinase
LSRAEDFSPLHSAKNHWPGRDGRGLARSRCLPRKLGRSQGASGHAASRQCFIDSLKRETKLGLSLAHPNIVRIYDFQNDENAAAISMEYVDGEFIRYSY